MGMDSDTARLIAEIDAVIEAGRRSVRESERRRREQEVEEEIRVVLGRVNAGSS